LLSDHLDFEPIWKPAEIYVSPDHESPLEETLMQDANHVTNSGKKGEGKPVLSSVLEAKPKLLNQLRQALRARH
jgi:hypothetical protein